MKAFNRSSRRSGLLPRDRRPTTLSKGGESAFSSTFITETLCPHVGLIKPTNPAS